MKKILLLLVLTGSSIFADAQWQQTSCPSINAITCLAVSGTNIFAGTNGSGVYLSTDNGTTWSPVNSGLTNTEVRALAVKGTDIYAGTYGKGMFVSANNGTSWTAVKTGLAIDNIVFISVVGGIIFVGTDNSGTLLFLSSDNGSSWSSVYTGINYFTSLTSNGSDLFAGTCGGTVSLSVNNGLNWSNASIGITATTIRAIAVCGTNILAGSEKGIFLSSNNGTTWSALNSTGSNINVAVFAVCDTNVFAGSYGGRVFLSSNCGATWADVSVGIVSSIVCSLTIAGTNIFAGTWDNGVWKRQMSEFTTSGIDEIKIDGKYNIYPNPATNNITVETLQKSTLEILNMQGQTILRQSLLQGKTDIVINGLAKGLYILRLNSNDKIEVTKILKE